jgi:hypothetical protein
MPIGKFRGKTLARIGANDQGLRDLDYYLGWDKIRPETKEQIEIYLNFPDNRRRLEALLDD